MAKQTFFFFFSFESLAQEWKAQDNAALWDHVGSSEQAGPLQPVSLFYLEILKVSVGEGS